MSRSCGPHLWPRGRTPEFFIPNCVGIEGWFTLTLIHARSGLIARELRFHNLIVDTGLDLLGTSQLDTILSHFAVGTSSTAPNAAQVSLGAQVGITNSSGGFGDQGPTWAAGNTYIYARRTRVFTTEQANDVLAEVGVFTASSGGTMWCRSLLKDSGGAATTIVKTNEFQLRVDYEVRLYPPNGWGDYTFDALVNGVSRTLTARPLGTSNIIAWNVLSFGLAPSTLHNVAVNEARFTGLATDVALRAASSTTSFAVTTTNKVNSAYVAGTHYREQTQEWNGSAANDTNYFLWGWNGMASTFQALFPVAFTKNNTQKFTIIARILWARRP